VGQVNIDEKKTEFL